MEWKPFAQGSQAVDHKLKKHSQTLFNLAASDMSSDILFFYEFQGIDRTSCRYFYGI